MEEQFIYIGLAAVFGIFMAWGIGANDVANAMATSVGSKALTIKQAILVAAVFEFLGAVLAGGEVTSTIRRSIVDVDLLSGSPELLIYGMLASLLAAGTWLLIASRNGWPVSTTHSIIGAIVGFAAVGIGIDAVQCRPGRAQSLGCPGPVPGPRRDRRPRRPRGQGARRTWRRNPTGGRGARTAVDELGRRAGPPEGRGRAR